MASPKNATPKTMPIIFISTIVVLTLLSLNFSAFSSLSPSAASSSSLRRQRPRVNFEFLPPPPTLKSLPHRNDSSFRFQYSADSEDVGYEIGSDSSNDDGEKNFEELSSAVLNGDFNDDDDDDDVREGIHQDSIDEEIFDDSGAGNASNKRGKIAWLMSFPNSGTSFTSLLARHASNATTASNYGMECNPGADGKSVPVYEWSEEGPYWLHPPTRIISSAETEEKELQYGNSNLPFASGTRIAKSGNYHLPPSSSYIFTKTHCGSRCADCPPKRYLETWQSFLKECLSGSRSVPVSDDNTQSSSITQQPQQLNNPKSKQTTYKKVFTTYHPSIVKKAVHLLRNPFDNLVSRFHHELKEHAKRSDTAQWMKRYPNSIKGFKTWCADQDAKYFREEHSVDWKKWSRDDESNLLNYFEGVACHAEFFRYAQWHSLASEVVTKMNIPVLYIYYEDYLTNLESTTEELLQFLDLPLSGELPGFDSNKNYSGYFTLEERAAASDLMRRVASADGVRLLERYWVPLDFDRLRKETKELD